MLSRAAPFGPNLGFVPLPENASQAVYDSLIERGFAHEAILDSYNFTGRGGDFKLNMLAFADRTRRTPAEYAGCSVYNATNGLTERELVSVLAQTAAPFHIIHRKDRFSFWASTLDGKTIEPFELGAEISYSQLSQVLQEYRVDLAPDQIVSVKQGRSQFVHPHLRKLEPLQLALWAIDVTRDTLVDRFGQAVTQLRTDMGARPDISDRDITGLAIQMLGATILADTGVFGASMRQQGLDLPLDRLLLSAAEQYPTYFRAMPDFRNDYDTIERAYRILRQIYYSGFVPDMLSTLYTRAYSKEQRKKLGFYDTPLYLTRRILQNIPIEFLPPEQRIVVDMGCGWGSFLIAGTERLSQIGDMRGRSLREHIIGNDIDTFTAQLAGLGLLLSTSEDSWRIDHYNALEWPWIETHKPGIIIGNPPFGGRRDQPESLDDLMPAEGERTRVEAANAHLERAIRCLSPGGYLAMVMPQSFLLSEAGPKVRHELLQTCDVQEIWQLPGQVFGEPKIQPMVVFAQKRRSASKLVSSCRVRNLQRRSLSAFETRNTFTSSSATNGQERWGDSKTILGLQEDQYIIDIYTVISELQWMKIHSISTPLSDLAVIFPGLTKGKGSQSGAKAAGVPSRPVRFLTDARRIMPREWYIDHSQAITANYPIDFARPRLEYQDELNGEKILLIASPNPSWGRRAKCAIDRMHSYPSFSFYGITLKPSARAEGINEKIIAVVLNWIVSNGWVAEHRAYPKIESRIVESIPFPNCLSDTDKRRLSEAADVLQSAGMMPTSTFESAQKIVDSILRAAYDLDDTTHTRLRAVSEWDEYPQITLDPQPDRSVADYIVSGIVEDVQAEQGILSLWLSGFEDIHTVPIDPLMPGWMLRPEAPFRAKIPFVNKRRRSLDGVVWNTFTPQQHTYQDEKELLQELDHVFGSGGEEDR